MPAKEPMKISSSAIAYANTPNYSTETISKPTYAPPVLPANVVPDGANPAIAMDNVSYAYANLMANQGGYGFVGYPALAALSTRSEYRAFAEAISTEITRKWIRFTSDNGDDENIAKRINELEKACEKFKLRGHIKQLSMLDALFGRAQIIANLRDQDRKTPLVLSPVTIKRKSLTGFAVIEPMWTTPQAYNSTQPDAPDFYKPNSWFMLGEEIHASRLMTLITRPVPDMLKPAFNFGGLSLTQLAEPYVENWLRTRQSVADLINNFSITALRTDMASVLSGGDGASIMARADLFTKTRSNRGLMILDKNMEEIVQTNTPLGGLHELQAQAQEQMCSVSHIPAIKLTGISPSGLNASSDGEFKAWYDWVAAQQQAHYRDILDTCIKIIQLSEFGEINPDIRWEFVPIEEMSEKERADIRMIDSQVAGAMIDRGVLDPQEERERLARDKHSGYNGLDLNIEVGQQDDEESDDDDIAQDEFDESKHPRKDNGQFGSGGGDVPKSVQTDIGLAIMTRDAYTEKTPYMDAWEAAGRDWDDFNEDGIYEAIKDKLNIKSVVSIDPHDVKNKGRKTSRQFVDRYKKQLSTSEAPPILIKRNDNGDMEIVEGGHRLQAAQESGAKGIKAIDVTDILNMPPSKLFAKQQGIAQDAVNGIA